MSTRRDDLPEAMPPTVTDSFLASPPAPWPSMPDIDARTHGLRALREWFAALRFQRTMATGEPSQPFAITKERIFIEQPDSIEGVEFPAIGVVPGRGQYVARNIGENEPDDSTVGIAGPGTALVVPCDYVEQLTVQAWASKISERRSIVACIEIAMQTYVGSSALRLVLRDYFDAVATFELNERENLDDIEVQRGRRRLNLYMTMTVPVIGIANVVDLKGPFIDLSVGSAGGASIDEAGSLYAGLTGREQLRVKIERALVLGGASGLRFLGFNTREARTIVRMQRGLSRSEAATLTDDYLLAAVLSLLTEAASLEMWAGRPPYSPSDVPARALQKALRGSGV